MTIWLTQGLKPNSSIIWTGPQKSQVINKNTKQAPMVFFLKEGKKNKSIMVTTFSSQFLSNCSSSTLLISSSSMIFFCFLLIQPILLSDLIALLTSFLIMNLGVSQKQAMNNMYSAMTGMPIKNMLMILQSSIKQKTIATTIPDNPKAISKATEYFCLR